MDDALTHSLTESIIQREAIFLCPKCKVRIPSITLTTTSNQLMTQIQCLHCVYEDSISLDEYLNQMTELNELTHFCLLMPNHTNLQATKYCFHCQKWICQSCIINHNQFPPLVNHLLLNYEIYNDLCCSTHSDKKNTLICNECHMILCQTCLEKHMNHEIVDFNTIEAELKSINIYQRLNEIRERTVRYSQSTEMLVGLIDKEIQKWVDIKKDLSEAYSKYEINNRRIVDLIIQFQINYELLKEVRSIELFHNIKSNVNINKEEANINDDKCSLEHKCLNYIQFLNNNSIINFSLSVKYLSTIQAHDNEINCMIQLKDGRIVTGSDDKTMKIWNIDTLKCEKTIKGKTEEIYSLTQINDEKIASGSKDFVIQLWSISNWNCIYTIYGHDDSIFGLIVLDDGSLASCSGDKSIKVWDLSEFSCINTFLGHTEAVFVLILLSNGLFASGSYDTTIRLWKSTKVESLSTLRGHSDFVTALLELKDRRLVSGSKDKTIIIWDINKCVKVDVIAVTRGIVFSLLQLKSSYLISGSYSDLTVWCLNSLQAISKFSHHCHYIKGLIGLNDKQVVSCSCDKTIRKWTIE